MMDITIGIATAAVAVFDVTSESNNVNVIITQTVTNPPPRFISDTHVPIASAAPDPLIKVPAANPPAKTVRGRIYVPWIREPQGLPFRPMRIYTA